MNCPGVHCPGCDGKTGIGIGAIIIALITGYIAYHSHSLMRAVTEMLIGGFVIAGVTIAVTVFLIVRKAGDNVAIPRYTPRMIENTENRRVILRETVTVREVITSPDNARAYVRGELEPGHEPLADTYPYASPAPAYWKGRE